MVLHYFDDGPVFKILYLHLRHSACVGDTLIFSLQNFMGLGWTTVQSQVDNFPKNFPNYMKVNLLLGLLLIRL